MQWDQGIRFLHSSPRWSDTEPSVATTVLNLMFINSTHIVLSVYCGLSPSGLGFGHTVGLCMEMALQKVSTAELIFI